MNAQRVARMTPEEKDRANELSNQIIGAAIEVHRHLGPGLLESVYESCLRHELSLRSIPFEHQKRIDLVYKGLTVEASLRLDLLVGGLVIVDLKAVDKLIPVHEAQLLSYLRLSKVWLGLLMNFNVPVLKNGIKRLVLD
jgi:GxxExxY protein